MWSKGQNWLFGDIAQLKSVPFYPPPKIIIIITIIIVVVSPLVFSAGETSNDGPSCMYQCMDTDSLVFWFGGFAWKAIWTFHHLHSVFQLNCSVWWIIIWTIQLSNTQHGCQSLLIWHLMHQGGERCGWTLHQVCHEHIKMELFVVTNWSWLAALMALKCRDVCTQC